MTLAIDEERFERTFEEYSAIGATADGGLHRLALSDADREVRDTFVRDLEALGLAVRIDELGNIFGRRPGSDPEAAPVLVGSHLDSQPYGGRYDGQLGVLAALETVRALDGADAETTRPVEIVNWTNEEGSRFEQAMLGSSTFVGATPVDEALALTDGDGNSVEEELARIGYDGDVPCEPHPVDSYLELHIEQGPKLDESGVSIGIVEGVFGLAWLEATVYGESDHAGPTTMHVRNDALAAASDAIQRIHELPNHLSEDAVTTVGRIESGPNSINVIPNETTFTVDVRSYDDEVVDEAVRAAEFEIATACEREGTTYDLDELWSITHTEFSPGVRDVIESNAKATDVSHQRIVSGAGHDASYLNDHTATGMVFVPSEDGKTHSEAEYTEWADVVGGARVFANTVYDLAN